MEEPPVVCLDGKGKWIAAIREPEGTDNHAIVCRGGFVLHDPAQHYGAIPRDRVFLGMRIVPSRRVVPRISLRGTA